jgi:hypothetical protein
MGGAKPHCQTSDKARSFRSRTRFGAVIKKRLGDGLYGSGMVQYAGTNKTGSMRIGAELSADVRRRVNQHLLAGAIAAQFIAGPAVQEALGKTVTFFVLFGTYRF